MANNLLGKVKPFIDLALHNDETQYFFSNSEDLY